MKTTGLGDVFSALDNVEKKIRKKGIRKGMNEATKIVAKAAKQKAVRVSGLLAKSIGRKVGRDRRKVTVGLVGPRIGFAGSYAGKPRDPEKYAHLVELGTAPHSVAKGDTLERKNRKGDVVKQASQTAGKMHPGAQAKPFLRPAADDNVTRVRDAIADAIAEVLA